MIVITPIKDHELYEVNGKRVSIDRTGTASSKQELTSAEKNAFQNYKKAVIMNPAFKKHTRAEYKF